jgi:N-acetylglucosaminyldiphosphoundecaprenol N-acetyl-beta-D-mannosaminyltransferase
VSGLPIKSAATGVLSKKNQATRSGIMRNAIADKAVKILGVKVHATSMDRAVSRIESLVASGDKGYVCVTGVHGIMEAQVDPNLKRIINNAALNIPDGRPTVWVGWLRGLFQMRQVTGPDMMLKIFGISAAKGYTHFFYGGNTGVAEQLRDELVGSFPGAKVVGT